MLNINHLQTILLLDFIGKRLLVCVEMRGSVFAWHYMIQNWRIFDMNIRQFPRLRTILYFGFVVVK